MNLQQIFRKVTRRLKTPEQIQKEIAEEMIAEKMGIKEEWMEVQEPLWTARVNFENFKALFKRDPAISKAGEGGGIDSDKFKIDRFRETNSNGDVIKSIDAIRIRDNYHNREYMDMVNRAFGVKAEARNGYIYINYNEEEIQKRKRKRTKDDDEYEKEDYE